MTTVNSKSKGTNGFFGTILASVQQGLAQGIAQAVPVWTNSVLNGQSRDQLAQPVYAGQYSPQQIPNYYQQPNGPQPRPALLDNLFANNNINSTAMLIGAAAIIAVITVAKA